MDLIECQIYFVRCVNLFLLSTHLVQRTFSHKIFICLQIETRRVHVEPVIKSLPTIFQQQIDVTHDLSKENQCNPQISRGYWYFLHRRYWLDTNYNRIKANDLLIARVLTLLIWFYVLIIEFLGYSHLIKPSSVPLNFLFIASYSWKDVSSILYASGAAAYGVSIEIYIIIPFLIINPAFAIKNCGIDHGETVDSLTYIAKVVALFLGTELSHQNFKRFTYQKSYKLHYLAATRAMLRQSIYLTITIMFLVSPGLRAIYNAARLKCPYVHESTNGSTCHLIDVNRPAFADTDPCVPDFTAMVTGFEQLRIIRDIALCSIAFYSMYNKAFLDISASSGIIHKIVLALFVVMSCSFIVANIDPFNFHNFVFFFDMVEILIFGTVIVLLIINVRKNSKHRRQIVMEASPTIFG